MKPYALCTSFLFNQNEKIKANCEPDIIISFKSLAFIFKAYLVLEEEYAAQYLNPVSWHWCNHVVMFHNTL